MCQRVVSDITMLSRGGKRLNDRTQLGQTLYKRESHRIAPPTSQFPRTTHSIASIHVVWDARGVGGASTGRWRRQATWPLLFWHVTLLG